MPVQLELYHHGVKGMKWGVRKARKQNPNYSQQQRLYDRAVYSRGASRRINRRMNQGHSISSARALEARRINNTRSRARVMGSITAIGASLATSYAMTRYVSPDVSGILATAGASAIAAQVGRYAGRSLTMAFGGYSPGQYRYA